MKSIIYLAIITIATCVVFDYRIRKLENPPYEPRVCDTNGVSFRRNYTSWLDHSGYWSTNAFGVGQEVEIGFQNDGHVVWRWKGWK